MRGLRFILLVIMILLYGNLFVSQEKKRLERQVDLQTAMPVSFYKIAAGYLEQLAAEILFIRTSVFLGGVASETPATSYADRLGNNFDVMTRLYPRFLDPYYFCQGFLANVSYEAAVKANTIFETGIAAYPDDLILRFFYGTNFFLSLNEPLKGARVFEEAARLPGAPPMFGHLAALLSAKGGDVAAGLVLLKAMLAVEKNDIVRARYEEEIIIFEQAMIVQKAITSYTQTYGTAPRSLGQLVPEFIPLIPVIKDSFRLVYVPPFLHLQRPEKK